MSQVKQTFKPEFINRLDAITIFSALSQKTLHHIIQVQLKTITNRLQDRNITLHIDDSALDFIIQQTYDPVYGARPLKRYLEKNIVTEISKFILQDSLPNNSILQISTSNQILTYNIQSQN